MSLLRRATKASLILSAISAIQASTFIELDHRVFTLAGSGVAEFIGTDTGSTRVIHGPAADRFATDGVEIFRLINGAVTRSPVGGDSTPFWSDATGANDLFLLGRELYLIRDGAPILRVDRFSGAELGVIDDITDGSLFSWRRAEKSKRLAGIRSTANGVEIVILQAGSNPRILSTVTTPLLRAISGEPWLTPSPSASRVWLPDGSLRNTEDGTVIFDLGATVNAATTVTEGSSAVTQGKKLRYYSHDGTQLQSHSMLRKNVHLSFQRKEFWAISSGAAIQRKQVLEEPFDARPVILPPHAGREETLLGFQMLEDGRVLIGNRSNEWAHCYHLEHGQFDDPFPLPRLGHVHAQPNLSRLAWSSDSSAADPQFADFTEFPTWEGVSLGGFPNTATEARLITDRSLILRRRSSGSTTLTAFNFTDGSSHQRIPNELMNNGPAAWDSESQSILFNDAGARISRYRESSGSITRVVTKERTEGLRNTSSIAVAPAGGHYLALDDRVQPTDAFQGTSEFDTEVLDAAWIGTMLYTLRPGANAGEAWVEKRPPGHMAVHSRTKLSIDPIALRTFGNSVVVIGRDANGSLVFPLLDAELAPAENSTQPAEAAKGLIVTSVTDHSIGLNWTPLSTPFADALLVEYRRSGSSSWISSSSVAPEATSATVTGLTADRSYDFRVVSGCGNFRSVSQTISASTQSNSSDMTSGALALVVRTNQLGQVEVSWEDIFTSETGYQLLITRTDSDSTEEIDLPANTELFIHQSAVPTTSYEYVIRAQGSNGPGPDSEPVTFHPGGLLPETGRILATVGQDSFGVHRIDFVAASDPAWQYLVIEASTDDEATWERLAVLHPEDRSYVNYAAPVGVGVRYRFNAGTAEGEIIGRSTFFHGQTYDSESTSKWYTRHDGVIYLLRNDTGQIDRFDTTSETWLTPIETGLGTLPKSIRVGDNGIFLSSSYQVFRVRPGENPAFEILHAEDRSKLHHPFSMWTNRDWFHAASPFGWFSWDLSTDLPPLYGPTSIATAVPDPSTDRVYGTYGYGLILFTEHPLGSFTERFRVNLDDADSSATLRHWREPGFLLNETGAVFSSSNFGYLVGRIGPWFDGGELATDRFLVRDSDELRVIDPLLNVVGSAPVTEREHAVSAGDSEIRVIGRSLTHSPFWTVRQVDAGPFGCLGFVQPGFPEAVSLPTFSHFGGDGSFTGLYHSQGLVANYLPAQQVPETTELDQVIIDSMVSPDGQTLYLLLSSAGGVRNVRIQPLSAPFVPSAEFSVSSDAQAIALEHDRLLILRYNTVSAYNFSGTYLGDRSDPDLVEGTYHPFDDLAIRLAFDSTYPETWTLEIGSEFSEPFPNALWTNGSLIVPDTESPWLFTWPGGVRSMEDPAASVHIHCVNPISAAWSQGRLLVLDRIGSNQCWLLAFDPATGDELIRRRVPATSHAMDVLSDGSIRVSYALDNGVHAPLGFDTALRLTDLGLNRAINVRWDEDSMIGVEGGSVSFYPEIFGDGPVSYQWKRNALTLSAQDEPTLTLENLSEIDSGNYSLHYSDDGHDKSSSVKTLVVRPTANIETRRGNILAISAEQLLEIAPNGSATFIANLPSTPAPEASISMDSLGRIHVFHKDPVGERPIVDTYDPTDDQWTQRVLPKSARRNLSAGAHALGQRLRVQDLQVDFGKGIVTRTKSSLIRSFGSRVDTDLGLETFEGQPLSSGPINTGLLPNQWYARALHNSYSGQNGVFFSNLNSGKVTFSTPPHQIQNPGLATGSNRIAFPSPEGIVEYHTNTRSWSVFSVGTDHKLHRIGSDFEAPLPDHAFDASTSRYLNHAIWNLPAKYGRSWYQFGSLGVPVFLFPNEPHPDGGTYWDHGTGPLSLPGENPPNVPYREENILRYQFMLPMASETEPISRIEFSHDLTSWSETPPESVSLDYEPFLFEGSLEIYQWQVRMRTDDPNSPACFMRIGYPDSPFK